MTHEQVSIHKSVLRSCLTSLQHCACFESRMLTTDMGKSSRQFDSGSPLPSYHSHKTMGNISSAFGSPPGPKADPEVVPKIPYSQADRLLYGTIISITAIYAFITVLLGSVLKIETQNMKFQCIIQIGNYFSLVLVMWLWSLGVGFTAGLAARGKKAWFWFFLRLAVLALTLITHICIGVSRARRLEYSPDTTGGRS